MNDRDLLDLDVWVKYFDFEWERHLSTQWVLEMTTLCFMIWSFFHLMAAGFGMDSVGAGTSLLLQAAALASYLFLFVTGHKDKAMRHKILHDQCVKLAHAARHELKYEDMEPEVAYTFMLRDFPNPRDVTVARAWNFVVRYRERHDDVIRISWWKRFVAVFGFNPLIRAV